MMMMATNDKLTRMVLVVSFFASISAKTAFAQTTDEKRPNILFILADDLGWRDVSFMGSKYYKTPHIDQLAQQGVQFSKAYAASAICSPKRASILTGLSPARLHITDWIPGGLFRPLDAELEEPAWRKHLPPGLRYRNCLPMPVTATSMSANGTWEMKTKIRNPQIMDRKQYLPV